MFTLIYSLLTYYMVYRIADLMRHSEFDLISFGDQQVANHSVIIRGINPKLGVSNANKLIKKLLE